MDLDIIKIMVGPFEENSWYVVENTSGAAVLIDPGDDPERIREAMRSTGTAPEAIINTHAHLDHIGGVKALQDEYNLAFYLHEDDEFLIDLYPEHAELFGVKVQGIPQVTHRIGDEDRLGFGELTVQVLHTPGHSPGGISLLVDNHLFSGDTLFAGSIGRTDLPGGDYDTLIHSIRTKLLPLDDDIRVHPGHGADTTIGEERRSNPFLAQNR